PAGAVEDAVFLAEERRQGRLELLVDLLGAADEADRRQAVAVAAQTLVGGLDDGRVIGQAEVVVGAEVDDVATVGADGSALRRLQLALALVQPAGAEVLELRAQYLTQVGVAHRSALDGRRTQGDYTSSPGRRERESPSVVAAGGCPSPRCPAD